MVKSQRATFRVMREGRESSEGRGPSAGQCSVLKAREESWLEVFFLTSRILPISLLVLKEGAHLEKIWKGKRQGEVQIPLLNTPIPPAHTQPCQQCHTMENPQHATKKRALTTNPTLMGLGGFSCSFSKSIFSKGEEKSFICIAARAADFKSVLNSLKEL